MTIVLDPLAPHLLSRHLTALCFACAALGALTARRCLLASLMTFGMVESYALWRFALLNRLRPLIENLFPGRSHDTMQTWLIVVGISSVFALVPLHAKYIKNATGWQRLTAAGCAAMLGMIAIELINRDDLVALIYHKIGPFTIFTWWIATTALMIAIGCLFGRERRLSPNRETL